MIMGRVVTKKWGGGGAQVKFNPRKKDGVGNNLSHAEGMNCSYIAF